jgi:hypothetical protein
VILMHIITESELRRIISEKVRLKSKFGDYMDKIHGKVNDILDGDIQGMVDSISQNVDTTKGVHGGSKNWGKTSFQQKKSQAAWNYLRPFLPKGAVLTSVFRSQKDQDRLIRKYAKKTGYSGEDNLDKMTDHARSKGIKIARHVGRGHGGKQNTCAFDISGASLDDIYSSVVFVSTHPELSKFAKFAKTGLGKGKSTIIERDNNAVHVHFNLDDIKTPYDPNFADSLVKKEEKEKED